MQGSLEDAIGPIQVLAEGPIALQSYTPRRSQLCRIIYGTSLSPKTAPNLVSHKLVVGLTSYWRAHNHCLFFRLASCYWNNQQCYWSSSCWRWSREQS